MNSWKYADKHTKRIIAIVAAAALVVSMALTALAANLWGIRSLFERSGQELPEQADEYILPQTAEEQNGDWSCRVTETLYDGQKLILSVAVSCSEKYVLVPTDATESSPAAFAGISSDKTLGDYAAEQGKLLMYVGAGIQDAKELDIIAVSQHFEHISDSEMLILVQADTGGGTVSSGVCSVYANGSRADLDFTVAENPEADTAIYIPADSDSVSGIQVGAATVTKTHLGVSVEFRKTVTDEALAERMEFRCKEISSLMGGSVKGENGEWYVELSGIQSADDQAALPDSLTIEVYDVVTGEHTGNIVFRKS